MLRRLSVIWTQKHGRSGWKIFSRVLVAAMQCNGRTSGSTTNSAINLGNFRTKSTKKAVNCVSRHMFM